MEFHQPSPIFTKTYDFVLWLLQRTQKFPKSQRFVMAKRVEETALNFQDCIIKAVRQERNSEALREADYELERLKIYLRICKDMKLLTFNQYEFSSKQILEIGKLLGGWLKKRQ